MLSFFSIYYYTSFFQICEDCSLLGLQIIPAYTVFTQPTRRFYLIKFSVMHYPSFYKTLPVPAKADRTQNLFAALARSKKRIDAFLYSAHTTNN